MMKLHSYSATYQTTVRSIDVISTDYVRVFVKLFFLGEKKWSTEMLKKKNENEKRIIYNQ